MLNQDHYDGHLKIPKFICTTYLISITLASYFDKLSYDLRKVKGLMIMIVLDTPPKCEQFELIV